MNIHCFLLSHRRMVLTLAIITSLVGFWSWFNMPRQEDPKLRDYWANISVAFPGTNAEAMERLVVDPLEEALAEVEEILHLDTHIQTEHASIHVELRNDVPDIENAWDEVRLAMSKAEKEFPEGVLKPDINTKMNDQESIVLAITGSDLLTMKRKTEDLKKKLLHLHEVVSVNLIADPGEQITLLLDDSQIQQSGITPLRLAQIIQGSNTKIPGGKVILENKIINLDPKTEFESIDDILKTPITLDSGVSVPLSEIAQVKLTPAEPARNKMRYMGMPAVGLGIVPRDGIHLVAFGEAVRDLLKTQQDPGISIHELTYQPARVQKRLYDLGKSLFLGILIVAATLLLFMGIRLGLVVASVVPLVAFSSLGIFAQAGGHLQQMSIAALVIALGMLVDNAIVVAENIQMRIDMGEPPREAAVEAISELAAPLASATGTTLAAFVPMLMATGITAEFTKDLPIVIMLTLTVSYFFAIAVTPVLSEVFLKPRKRIEKSRFQILSEKVSGLTVERPIFILSVVGMFVLAMLMLAPFVRQQFFPSSDRNQVVIELKLPEGTHLSKTESMVEELETAFGKHNSIKSYASFIGRSAPHFYYNIAQVPWSPHFAQILITTQTLDQVDPLVDEIREFAERELPGANMMPRKLEQGPPFDSPIAVRLFGSNSSDLASAADSVLRTLREIPGVRDSRHEMSQGTATINLDIHEMKAAQLGLNRAQIAQSMFGRLNGIPVGHFRAGKDPVPILIRSTTGEEFPIEEIESMQIYNSRQESVPLGQLAAQSITWESASITHRNGARMTKVISQLGPNTTFSEVQSQLELRLSQLELPKGITIEYGGQAEGSSEANSSMMGALPIGMILLFGILLVEFNSFRRVAIILVTVPLAAAGVLPGLLIGDHPFGFMSLLGVVALVGVVVNNAIVLIDLIETQRNKGIDIKEAIHISIQQRTRPILLTTLTTVAGLMPLALAPSTLWPPLASAMISGLLASTILTLAVVPSLYYLIFKSSSSSPVETRKLCQEI